MTPIDIDETRIGESIAETLGNVIVQPTLFRLGNPITGLVQVPLGERSNAAEVYVHRDGDDAQSVLVVRNAGPGKLPDDKLIFRSFVLVKDGVLFGEAIENAAYEDGAPVAPLRAIAAAQLDFGLLQPTQPPSMKCLVSGWRYFQNNTVYDVPTLLTADLTASIPGASLARAVLVELDPTTNTLYTTNGATFSNTLSHTDAFATYYPRTLTAGRFTIGYIRLYNTMTAILADDLFLAQEWFNKGGGEDYAPLIFTGWPA